MSTASKFSYRNNLVLFQMLNLSCVTVDNISITSNRHGSTSAGARIHCPIIVLARSVRTEPLSVHSSVAVWHRKNNAMILENKRTNFVQGHLFHAHSTCYVSAAWRQN